MPGRAWNKSCERTQSRGKRPARPGPAVTGNMAAGLCSLAVMAFVNLGSMKAPQTAYMN